MPRGTRTCGAVDRKRTNRDAMVVWQRLRVTSDAQNQTATVPMMDAPIGRRGFRSGSREPRTLCGEGRAEADDGLLGDVIGAPVA